MAIDKEREALVEMLNDMDGYPLTSSQKHALIAALTAQQEPVAMKYEIQRTAPKRIWLVMSDDPSSETDAFPKNYGEEITWCEEQVTQFDVPYVRADTAALVEKTCSTDPNAPHGFDRNASHSENRYVCECEHYEAMKPTERKV